MEIQRHADGPGVWRLGLSPSPGREQIVLSEAGLSALQQTLEQAAHDDSCRVLVLEGSGGSFCEGMDLGWVTTCDEADIHRGLEAYARCLQSLREAPQLVLCLVDGSARAGGVGLAAAADLLVATEASSFGLPEVTLGLLPAMVLPLLTARITPQRARRWALTSATLDGPRAHQWGLVDELVEDAAALQKTSARLLRQLLRMNPEAVAAGKRFCQEIQAMALPQALAHGAKTTGQMLLAPGRLDAIGRFLEGEPLPWFARYRRPQPQTEAAP